MPPAFRVDVAAEAGAVLAGEDGVDEVEGSRRGIELLEGDPGLDDRGMVLGVELEDLIHPLEADRMPP